MALHTFVILAMILGATLQAEAQSSSGRGPTLVESARQHGGISRNEMGCGWVNGPPTLETLLKKADVVVHGTVVSVVGKLSQDQHEVWTDYTVQPITVVHDGTPDSHVVGSSNPPVFTTRGGTVYVEGLKISHNVDFNGNRVRLDVGDEVVLLAKLADGKFDLEPYGVFPVQAGYVRPSGRWPQLSSDDGPVDLATFVSRVTAITSH